ncbi:MAG: hypothetical protein EF812_06185 [Methanosarcinales archaeon]|nr:MAG: hypothetical protein EF812_06185 [Methanosarcinales archaeon]
MNKSQIQEKTKKLFEKADNPKEFTKKLQGTSKSYTDKEAKKITTGLSLTPANYMKFRTHIAFTIDLNINK